MFIILLLILAIPAVQNGLGNYATKKLNEEFGTNINIEKIGLRYNGDVSLKEIYVEDFKQDTLIYIKDFKTSIVSFRNLYQCKLNFGDVEINEIQFTLVTYRDETK